MPVEFYQDLAKEWRWRLKGNNGEVVAQGESHDSRAHAQRAFLSAVRIGMESASEIIQESIDLKEQEAEAGD